MLVQVSQLVSSSLPLTKLSAPLTSSRSSSPKPGPHSLEGTPPLLPQLVSKLPAGWRADTNLATEISGAVVKMSANIEFHSHKQCIRTSVSMHRFMRLHMGSACAAKAPLASCLSYPLCCSGWAWLVKDGSGVAISKSPNAENPLASGQTPLLTMDVWEHAYYGTPFILTCFSLRAFSPKELRFKRLIILQASMKLSNSKL